MNDIKEIWKDIPGFEGLYQASNLGRIRGLRREVFNGHKNILKKEQILKPNTLAKGYLQVTLSDHNKMRHSLLVHRLVASAFIDNPKGLNQINHLNGIKDDNRVENLEWCNNAMNQLHAWQIGLQRHSPLSGKPKRKVAMLDDKGNIEMIFESIAATARYFGYKKNANLHKCLHKKPHYNTFLGKKFCFYESSNI